MIGRIDEHGGMCDVWSGVKKQVKEEGGVGKFQKAGDLETRGRHLGFSNEDAFGEDFEEG